MNREKINEIITQEPEQIISEIHDNDKRFHDNKNIELSKCNLGQLGEVLDSVYNPYREYSKELEELYAEYLDCEIDDIINDKKLYGGYRINILKYCIHNMKRYKKEKFFSDKKSNIYQDKNFDLIRISQDKEIRIPTSFHAGIKNKSGKKIILKTNMTSQGILLYFFYKKGDFELVDEFVNYIDEQIKKNNFYKGQKISPSLEFLKLGNTTWDDVILKEDIKDRIRYNITNFFRKEEIYKKNGIASKCGLIWEGLPGTGKTISAQALANDLSDITLIWVTPDDIYNAYEVKGVFDLARELNPSIIFFEDADLFCSSRSAGGSNSILGEIMNQLDGFVPLENVVTIFTSNEPEVLEKALIDRPGRFDERIEFPPPDKDQIVQMMKVFLKIPNFNIKDIKEVAEKCEGFNLTGAHIKRLCDLSVINAINSDSLNKRNIAQLKEEHFSNALDKIKNMKIKAGETELEKKKSISNNKNSIPHGSMPVAVESNINEAKQVKKSFIDDILNKRL
ncbi:MAG: AAA family ATPase [Bacillota bacterium]